MMTTHPDTLLALIHQRQQELINEASERRRAVRATRSRHRRP
jgi:hypothetical protein